MSGLRHLFLILALFSGLAQAGELTVALGMQDPLQVRGGSAGNGFAGEQLVALNSDLAREICIRIKAHCTVVNQPIGEILQEVEAGRVDLGFGNFLRTPERERRVAFSDPLWRSSSRLLGAPATTRAFAAKLGQAVTLDNLRGARVAVIAGSQQHDYLVSIATEHKLTMLATPTTGDAVKALREKQVDFALLPVVYAYAQLSRDTTQQLAFAGPPVVAHGLGGSSHIALPKQKESLRRSVNQAIAAMRSDGTFQRIVLRHLPLGLD